MMSTFFTFKLNSVESCRKGFLAITKLLVKSDFASEASLEAKTASKNQNGSNYKAMDPKKSLPPLRRRSEPC